MAATILLVEDNALNLRLLKDLLEYYGHAVYPAVDVDDALRAFEARTYDVAVVDIQIPGGGGQELLRILRAHPNGRELPILAVTAQSMQGDRERLLSAGFDGYFSKPIDTKTLVGSIESFVKPRNDA